MKNEPQNLKRLVLAVVTLAIILPLIFGSASCTQKPEPVTSGDTVAPIFQSLVAEDQHLFTDNGLLITKKAYDTGAQVQAAVVSGEVDLAALSEYGVVNQVLKKADLSIIAVFQRSDYLKIVGRKNAGIAGIADLKGKRVGVGRGTVHEFYLGRTLNLNGLKITDVTPVNLTPAQTVAAYVKGEVDAIVTYEPFISQAQQQVPDSVTWVAQSNQLNFTVFVGRTDWIKQHPETVKRFLKAMDQANNYITGHPAETDAILLKYGIGNTTIKVNRSQTQFGLSLDFSLITAMDAEARWMIENNLTTEKTVPNFKDYIYLDGLKAIKPEAVNIVR